MKQLVVILVFVLACTKPNPNRCCTDEADCNAKDIPVGSICEAGLVCRGNQCISEPCTSAADCEASAPYCVAELCAETCTEDAQCPGFGQSSAQTYCVDGSCHECRVAMNDCGATAPVCDQGTCRGCQAHGECASGVCGDDGTCVAESSISYVETTGSSTSDCTRASPCSTITRAVSLARPYVLIGAGTYTTAAAIALSGQLHLIGSSPMPVVTRSTAGPIITLSSGQVTLENLQVSGATTNGTLVGEGIACSASGGAPKLDLLRVVVRDNAFNGLHTTSCLVCVSDRVFTMNGRGQDGSAGMKIENGTGTIDRCVISLNNTGMDLDSGLYQVTNSFIYRNDGTASSFGINLYSTEPGNRVEFNTLIDNGLSAVVGNGFNCNLQGVTGSFQNNIIARNRIQTGGTGCTYPGSIIVDADVTALKFKSPDAAPYDYHITSGSSAIDAATQSTVDHDFDGDPRTSPRDVGADEFVP
jgi:hypothetical protein